MDEKKRIWEELFGGRGVFGRQGSWGRGDFWEMFAGPPPRADRGVVRWLVLDAVAAQPRHGYEIMQAIEERSGGAYRPSPGVIYPTLQLLEELRLLKGEEQDGRKTYALTAEGKKQLADHRDEVDEFYERSGADEWEDYAEELGDLLKRVGRLLKSFRRSARRGRLTPAVMKKLRAVLDRALAEIEEIVGAE